MLRKEPACKKKRRGKRVPIIKMDSLSEFRTTCWCIVSAETKVNYIYQIAAEMLQRRVRERLIFFQENMLKNGIINNK